MAPHSRLVLLIVAAAAAVASAPLTDDALVGAMRRSGRGRGGGIWGLKGTGSSDGWGQQGMMEVDDERMADLMNANSPDDTVFVREGGNGAVGQDGVNLPSTLDLGQDQGYLNDGNWGGRSRWGGSNSEQDDGFVALSRMNGGGRSGEQHRETATRSPPFPRTLVGVLSAPGNFAKRRAIRASWVRYVTDVRGSHSLGGRGGALVDSALRGNITVAFFVGNPSGEHAATVEEQLQAEGYGEDRVGESGEDNSDMASRDETWRAPSAPANPDAGELLTGGRGREGTNGRTQRQATVVTDSIGGGRGVPAGGDLVRLPDLSESYENLTLKTAMMIEYALEADYDVLFKVDDDDFVRLDIFADALRELQLAAPGGSDGGRGGGATGTDDLYWGRLKRNVPVIKDPSRKWFEPKFLGSIYPDYMLGSGYVIGKTIMRTVAEQLGNGVLPLYSNEDASVGIWAQNLTLRRVRMPQMVLQPWCDEGAVVINSVEPFEQVQLWQAAGGSAGGGNVCSNGFYLDVCRKEPCKCCVDPAVNLYSQNDSKCCD